LALIRRGNLGVAENSNLYDAAKAYVRAAMDLLANVVQKAPAEILPGSRRWVRSGDIFLTHDREMPYWERGIISHHQVLHELPEYKVFLHAIEGDSTVARYLGPVLTVRGGGQATSQELADTLLWWVAQRCSGFAFESLDFDLLFQNFEADLRREYIEFVEVAPLPGFRSDIDVIQLGSNFEIAELKDEEVIRCLHLSIYPSVNLGGVVLAGKTYGLRRRFSEKKFFGDLPPEIARSQSKDTIDLFSRAVHALRLFKRGTISIPGIVAFSDQWPMDGGISASHMDPGGIRGNDYEFASGEREAFENLWQVLNSPLKRFQESAIRRFAYAGERRRPEDRLVDLMISAESLFLSDTGEARERGELRYRLALRAAFFVEIDTFSRKDLYRFVRSAYDARSALVHGGLPDNSVLKVPQKGSVPLSDFVSLTEDVMRAALLKAVKTPTFDEKTLVDWDSLILS
jgi:Apea-like HEPN